MKGVSILCRKIWSSFHKHTRATNSEPHTTLLDLLLKRSPMPSIQTPRIIIQTNSITTTMTGTSDHFPHPPQQTPSSRPASGVPASASSEPRPQESSSWSHQAFISPSMPSTTTPVMNWMQSFTTPVPVRGGSSSQYDSLLRFHEQLQYPHAAALHSTLSLLEGLTTPFALTEAVNYQAGPPVQQQERQAWEYPLHKPLPSAMVLSLPSPSYPHTPIPHRPLQKRPIRDEEETIPVTQELMEPNHLVYSKDEDGMRSMAQELLTSPLAESPPKRRRKASSFTNKKPPSSSKKKRKMETTPSSPKSMLGPAKREVDVICLRRYTDHPGNLFYDQLVEEQARFLAQKQWELNHNQNTKVELAGSEMGLVRIFRLLIILWGHSGLTHACCHRVLLAAARNG